MKLLSQSGRLVNVPGAVLWRTEECVLVVLGKRNRELAWFNLSELTAWWYDNETAEVSRP